MIITFTVLFFIQNINSWLKKIARMQFYGGYMPRKRWLLEEKTNLKLHLVFTAFKCVSQAIRKSTRCSSRRNPRATVFFTVWLRTSLIAHHRQLLNLFIVVGDLSQQSS